MLTPALSVITVCRNEASVIRRTAESILRQTEQGFEWIVVDGASTDDTTGILREVAGHRIDRLISEPDHGIYNAMNKGLHHASAPYVLFLNGGDTLHGPGSIEECLPFFGRADVLYGGVRQISGESVNIFHPDVDPVHPAYFYRNTLPHQATLAKRSLFEHIGGFDETYRILGDRDWLYRAARERATFFRMPQIVSDFYIGGVSSAPENAPTLEAERRRFRMRHFLFRTLCDGAAAGVHSFAVGIRNTRR